MWPIAAPGDPRAGHNGRVPCEAGGRAISTKLTFHGAVGEVTGSCTQLKSGRNDLLIDFGMIQGGRYQAERNRSRPSIRFRALSGVVLTHAHLDHCGRLPLLDGWGYHGPIHATPATCELVEIILTDSARLMARDAEHKSRRRQRRGAPEVTPIYDERDVKRVLRRLEPLPYGEERELGRGALLRFHDAGHILGSAIAELELGKDARRRVVFSGDIGKRNTPILRDPTVLETADLVVMESTYGDRDHRPIEDTLEELTGILEAARCPRGKVLIPAFAVGRSQEILYRMAELRRQGRFEGVPVMLDSPMAIRATRLYDRHTELYDEEARALVGERGSAIRFDDLRTCESPAASRAINAMGDGAVVIAGAGMMTGGRILHHLKHGLWRKDTHLVVIGYQASGTLGRAIVDGARRVRVMGQELVVKAQVHTLGGFSAHADQTGLLAWAEGFAGSAPTIALNHGEDHARDALAARIEHELGYEVLRPDPGDTLSID